MRKRTDVRIALRVAAALIEAPVGTAVTVQVETDRPAMQVSRAARIACSWPSRS
jgi:hypothetical protein